MAGSHHGQLVVKVAADFRVESDDVQEEIEKGNFWCMVINHVENVVFIFHLLYVCYLQQSRSVLAVRISVHPS